jgi:hypothetical protein
MKMSYSSPKLTVHGSAAAITRIGGYFLTDIIAGLPTLL